MKNIRTEHLSKSFDNDIALKDINLSLEKGKIYGLIGRNGAGKSTLLRIISNRIFPTSGKVYYDDVEISKVKDLACVYLDEAQSQTMEGEKIIKKHKIRGLQKNIFLMQSLIILKYHILFCPQGNYRIFQGSLLCRYQPANNCDNHR